MRNLDSNEVEGLKPVIDQTIELAYQSPCFKSKRGVTIFRNGQVLGAGYNSPSLPRKCFGEECASVCGFYTIHAERNAIHDALSKRVDLSGASFLHIRVKNGVVKPVEKTTCDDCVPYLLKVGRSLKEPFKDFIVELPEGYAAMTLDEMNREIKNG